VYKQYLKQDPSFMIEEYQGQYLNDQKHGLGTLTNVDGVFEGDFVNDKREGNVRDHTPIVSLKQELKF
jgi:hypothetical protein